MEPSFETRPSSTPSPHPGRATTPQRLKYDAEINVFKSRHGDLEFVRKTLGFSRRKMCQLLLVDPSAWSRWHAPGGNPPPHVFRALEWFLALEGKTDLHPRLADIYLRQTHASPGLGPDLKALAAQVARLKIAVWVVPIAAAALTALAFIVAR